MVISKLDIMLQSISKDFNWDVETHFKQWTFNNEEENMKRLRFLSAHSEQKQKVIANVGMVFSSYALCVFFYSSKILSLK